MNAPTLAGSRASVIIGDGILPSTGPTPPGEPLTMSSREIAELLGSRPDDVKRSIERLAAKDVFTLPPLAETSFKDAIGKTQRTRVYLLDKRSSLIVVAQLSPEFTARVVDRWQELEAQVAAPKPALPDFTNPVIAARAWADEVEGRLLEAKRGHRGDTRELYSIDALSDFSAGLAGAAARGWREKRRSRSGLP